MSPWYACEGSEPLVVLPAVLLLVVGGVTPVRMLVYWRAMMLGKLVNNDPPHVTLVCLRLL